MKHPEGLLKILQESVSRAVMEKRKLRNERDNDFISSVRKNREDFGATPKTVALGELAISAIKLEEVVNQIHEDVLLNYFEEVDLKNIKELTEYIDWTRVQLQEYMAAHPIWGEGGETVEGDN